MITKTYNKKTLAFILIVLTFVLSQFGIIFLNSNITSQVYAYSSSVSISNADFKSYTGNSPYTPTYWSSADGSSTSVVTSGVVDITDFSSLELDAYTFSYDNLSDNYILMIKSKGINGSSFGYKNSSTITMSSNSYYKVTVQVKTSTQNNGASIYLTGIAPDTSNDYNFVNITSTSSLKKVSDSDTGNQITVNYSDWNTYTFYIETDTAADITGSIELWLGAKNTITSIGEVYFDNISIEKIGHSDYYGETSEYRDDSTRNSFLNYNRVISLKDSSTFVSINNGDFEQGDINFEQASGQGNTDVISGIANIDSSSETFVVMGLDSTKNSNPGNTKTYNNTKALFIHNTEAAYASYKTTQSITIAQHGYYVLNVFAKTGNLDGGSAFIKLIEDVVDGETAITKTISSVNSSSDSRADYNNYAMYSFYICGNPYKDITVTLELGLGTEATPVAGYVIFDDITLQRISYKIYNTRISGDEFSSAIAFVGHTESNSETILNGAFNFSANAEANITYPLTARNWTANNTESGIVSLNSLNWQANKANYDLAGYYPDVIKNIYGTEQDTSKTTNNVMMLRNSDSNTYAQIVSDEFTINGTSSTSESIIAIEFYLQTYLIDTQVGVSASLVTTSGHILATLNINDDNSTISNAQQEWTKYTIYFKNGYQSLTAQLVFSLGDKDNSNTGYVFIDYVKHTNVQASMLRDKYEHILNPTKLTVELFESIKTNTPLNTVIQDLSIDGFTSFIKNSNGVHTSNSFTAPAQEGVIAGVVNTNDSLYPSKRPGATDNYILMIRNNMFTNFSYTSAVSYSFTESSYYKISLWVYTKDILAGEVTIDEDLGDIRTKEEIEDNIDLFGVYISLDGAEKTFRGIINSDEDNDNNGWEQYNFYIRSDEDINSAKLVLSLGSSQYPTMGYAFFDDIQIIDIAESEYNKVDIENSHNLITVASNVDGDTEGEDKKDEENNNNNQINGWLIASSVILVVALLVALFGVGVRKIKFKKPFKRKEFDYSRNSTLNEDVVKRELAEIRKEKLKIIDNELAELQKIVDQNKVEYEASIKADKNKIKVEKLFSKYAKERSKLQKQLDSLNSARAYITDSGNIKMEEYREIRKRVEALEEDNKKLQKQAALKEKTKNKNKSESE